LVADPEVIQISVQPPFLRRGFPPDIRALLLTTLLLRTNERHASVLGERTERARGGVGSEALMAGSGEVFRLGR